MIKNKTANAVGFVVAALFTIVCTSVGVVVIGIVLRCIVWLFLYGYRLWSLP